MAQYSATGFPADRLPAYLYLPGYLYLRDHLSETLN